VRLAHLRTPDGVRLGIGVGSTSTEVLRLDAVAPDAPATSMEFLAANGAQQNRWAELARTAAAAEATRSRLATTGALGSVDELTLAPPIPRPSKVIGVALNYRSHAAEGGFEPPSRPVVFLKGPNSLVGHGQAVLVPPQSERIDHEGELGVVIGRRVHNLDPSRWREAVAGYTIVNDLTARDWQLEDIQHQHPWALTKSFDGYGPVGPWLVTPDEVPDPGQLDLEVRVDGTVTQSSNTRHMIFGVGALIIFLSQVLTLEPGDLIATGTPDGIGPVPDGQTVEVRIAKLGILRNPVRFQSTRATPIHP
jgi:2-keto-4-pentenoate hydratase/2-oxohepta-3-ene-1,7-dioic acid hydratase in catechol pathway